MGLGQRGWQLGVNRLLLFLSCPPHVLCVEAGGRQPAGLHPRGRNLGEGLVSGFVHQQGGVKLWLKGSKREKAGGEKLGARGLSRTRLRSGHLSAPPTFYGI